MQGFGSNLMRRDNLKTRKWLHSVNRTSTRQSLPGQDIIHSPLARVVWMISACIKALRNARIDRNHG